MYIITWKHTWELEEEVHRIVLVTAELTTQNGQAHQ